MIVEFTGCSGAGKTSLARRVREVLRERAAPAIDPLRLVLGPRLSTLLPARPLSTHLENAVVELLGWPSTILARRRYAACDGLVRHWIRGVSVSRAERLRLSRSWNRKLAVVNWLQQSPAPPGVLLHDEGMVHFAITLLARWASHPPNALDQYLQSVPLPTCVVRVDAPPDRRKARLEERSMKPVPDRDRAARDEFFERSQCVMERLTQHPCIARRVLHVANDLQSFTALTRTARHVANHIVAWPIETASQATAVHTIQVATE